MAKGFKVADAYVEVNVDDTVAKNSIRNLDRDIGPEAEKAGQRTGKRFSDGLGSESEKGGKDSADRAAKAFEKQAEKTRQKYAQKGDESGSAWSRAMSLSFLRNAPLVTAVAAGVLIAGAPAMAAAAGLLFGGLGIAFAAQNDTVRAGFAGLQDHVKQQGEGMAASLLPSLNRITTSLTHTFDALSPSISRAFAASGPLVEKLTTGVERFALNAMPGMVHSIEAGGPVFDGLSSFLASTGTGLGHFFDLISQHGPASGQVFAGLGSIVQSLLSILGDLSGQGAELGGVVLPLVASALGVVADALHVIAPVLPIVVAGFSGFRLASAAGGYLSTFSKQLQFAAGVGLPFSGAIGGAGKAVGALGAALPILGIGLGIIGMGFSAQSQQIDGWAGALLKGGTAADQATEAMKRQAAPVRSISGILPGIVGGFKEGIAQLKGYSGSSDEATQKMKAQLAAMDPLSRAQALQTQALNNLNDAIDKYGPFSDQAVAAGRRYEAASRVVAEEKAKEEKAIEGVTAAMIAEANEEDARANSDIAYRQSVIGTKDAMTALADAQKHLHDANKNTRTSTEDVQKAALNAEMAMLHEAEAAGKLASDALPATMSANEKSAAAANASLKELDKLAAMYGGHLPPNLEAYRQGLLRVAGQVDQVKLKEDIARAAAEKLGAERPTPVVALAGVPDTTAKTKYVMDNMSALGGMRPAPVGRFVDEITPSVYGAQRAINQLHGTTITNFINTLYSTSYARGMSTGGPIKAATGMVVGPGGPTDDRVPAVTTTGVNYLLSPREWIINAAVSDKQGAANMAALNAGKASIVPNGSGANPTTGTGITVEHLEVNLNGTFDFGDPRAAQAAAVGIRDALVKLERSYR